MKTTIPLFLLLLLSSCAVSKNYHPSKKYSPGELREDYRLFRSILEESHPSLYWYTPKDSMDLYFEAGEQKISDSMPEHAFRNILSYVLAKVRCGHTTVRPSREATRYAERNRGIVFPLGVKIWDDTAVVTSNLNRRDSMLTRGAVLRSIEGRAVGAIVDSFFQHLSTDGYNTTHRYQTLSNSGVFRSMYGSIYGLRNKMSVEFIDTAGRVRSLLIGPYNPAADSTARSGPISPRPSRRERKKMILHSQRNMRIDTSLNTAFLEVNTFVKKYRLRGFFRRSFRELRRKNISHLVIDVRGNGGGNVTLSNLLTKYIADKPFKIADSLYAITNKSRFRSYQKNYFLNRLFMVFMTRKEEDGYYHFNLFEGKYFKPRKKNHFNGTAYILTGGNTFSAASLFTRAVIGQDNVIVVGEETGGGAYGNSAWLIPDVTLPNTKVRFRLPLFRLVIDKDSPRGRGVLPEVESKPSVDAIRRNVDFKMETVIQLIKSKKD